MSRLLRAEGLILFVGLVVARALGLLPRPGDLHAYIAAGTAEPYRISTAGALDAYLYSPAFTQAIEPLRWLSWELAGAAWLALSLAALWWLAPLAWPLLLPVVAVELLQGNVHLLYAAALVLALRWPGAWALLLLTKVTPGIGLLWYAARREWRQLGVALVATAAVAATSYVVAPHLWSEWLASLMANASAPSTSAVPGLAARLPAAAVLTVWGARTSRPWVLPLAVLLALPVLRLDSLAVLAAVPALVRSWPTWPRRLVEVMA